MTTHKKNHTKKIVVPTLPEVSPTGFDWTRWSQSRPSRCAWHCPWSQSCPGMAGSSWGRSLPAPGRSAAGCHEACAPTGWSAKPPHWSQYPFESQFSFKFLYVLNKAISLFSSFLLSHWRGSTQLILQNMWGSHQNYTTKSCTQNTELNTIKSILHGKS